MPTVLLVEDEPLLRESVKDLLEDEGYQVREAADGQAAIDSMTRDGAPALVLLDLVLPKLSGQQVYEWMKSQDGAVAQVPVIISTSDSTRAPRGVPLLLKPLAAERLLRLVQQLTAVPQA